MSKKAFAISALALLMLLASGLGTAGAATPGYAVYNIQVSSTGHTHSVTINETVTSTSNPASDDLILSLVSGNLTASYTRTINSSDVVAPFIPAISNQTFSTSYNGSTVSANIVKSGTSNLQFQGETQTLTVYSLSITAQMNGSSASASGTISTFQSGLLDSVNLTASVPTEPSAFPMVAGSPFNAPAILVSSQVNLLITLVSTSLPLGAPSSSTAAQAASAGIGVGIAASAVAIGLGVRRHNTRGKAEGPSDEAPADIKPEHWVD